MTGRAGLLKTASILALLTIGYNIIEGMVSVWFGVADETISLFGFGLDSFVEVASGIGVWHMVGRMKAQNATEQDAFEQRALRITGASSTSSRLGWSLRRQSILSSGTDRKLQSRE